jgi:hypothetical protein
VPSLHLNSITPGTTIVPLRSYRSLRRLVTTNPTLAAEKGAVASLHSNSISPGTTRIPLRSYRAIELFWHLEKGESRRSTNETSLGKLCFDICFVYFNGLDTPGYLHASNLDAWGVICLELVVSTEGWEWDGLRVLLCTTNSSSPINSRTPKKPFAPSSKSKVTQNCPSLLRRYIDR